MIRRQRWSRRAESDLENLDPVIRRQIIAAVDRLAETGGSNNAIRLRGNSGEWRLRVRDWRVKFHFNYSEGEMILEVTRVQHRRESYR